MTINKDFEKNFNELKKCYYDVREKVSSFSEEGVELEKKLLEEIDNDEPWRFYFMDKLGKIVSGFDLKQKEIHQNYIKETKYHQIVQEAPFYWRIMNKPSGYPGDMEMMNIIYRNQLEGETPFGMYLHKHAVSTKACQSVRNRKEFLVKKINGTGGGKILSLAAGPIIEIIETLNNSSREQFYFIALDHDIEALKQVNGSFKHSRLTYAIANAFQIIKGKYNIAIPKSSLERYCDPKKDFKGLRKIICTVKYKYDHLRKEDFDLVYTAGLYDYIKTFPSNNNRGTVALTKNLFTLVKPGGSLIIGNFSFNNPRDLIFPMEYVYDWQLFYRDKQEILNFAKTIPENEIKNIQVLEEPLGINYFLKIDKN